MHVRGCHPSDSGRGGRAIAALLLFPALALILACAGAGSNGVTTTGAARVEVQERFQRGVALMRQGQDEGAASEFRRCIALDPKDPRPRVQLGRLLAVEARRAGERVPVEAAEELKKAVELDPKDIQARFELTQVLWEHQVGLYDPDRVVDLFDGILRDNPSLSGVRLRYATWLIMSEVRLSVAGKEGKVTKDSAWTLDVARSNLEKVIDEVSPGSEEARAAHLMMADVLLKFGAWPEALREAQLVLDRYPDIPLERRTQALSIRAQALMRQSLYREAIDAYRQAYDLDHSDRALWGIFQCSQGLGGYPPELPKSYRFPLRAETTAKGLPPPPRFRDIAPELGIDKFAGAGPAGWADYDGDGL